MNSVDTSISDAMISIMILTASKPKDQLLNLLNLRLDKIKNHLVDHENSGFKIKCIIDIFNSTISSCKALFNESESNEYIQTLQKSLINLDLFRSVHLNSKNVNMNKYLPNNTTFGSLLKSSLNYEDVDFVLEKVLNDAIDTWTKDIQICIEQSNIFIEFTSGSHLYHIREDALMNSSYSHQEIVWGKLFKSKYQATVLKVLLGTLERQVQSSCQLCQSGSKFDCIIHHFQD